MDAKDLRTESAVSERNNDGSKYSQSGGIALHCDRNKSYQDLGSNSLGKVDVASVRPCAVIGPDRVVPPPSADAYHVKKGTVEPWPCMDNAYRRPPEYPHKLNNFQNPTRNISPRQTFQENMQRIMVPPTYNSKINDDTNNYAQMSDRSNGLSKNIKLNVPPEVKFCDVPYSVNPSSNEQKSVRNPEMCLPSVNPTLTRTAPHGWPSGSVNLRSTRMYGAPELYQYQDYPSCAGPRPVVPRPHRTVPEEQGYVYADHYYQDGNIRFKPYPSVKERYPQQRYEYISNYSNPFHPPPGFPSHKYELQKSMPPHPYPPYPSIKYLDGRVEPVMEGYQRNPQGNYNIPYRNQVIYPNYGPVLGNCSQNKMHSYPPDAPVKTVAPNKLPYDNNTKAYIEYENNRQKIYPPSENFFVNEMARMPMKSQVIMPNYPGLNMHNIPPNPYYKKDHQQMKNYEHMAHLRNMDPNINVHNMMTTRHQPVFSPNTIAISPTDSSTSNDTTQTLGTSQEDFGYVSQSSTASVRSIDSGINRIPNDCLRKYYDNRYGPIVRPSHMMSKSQLNSNSHIPKKKKNIDVRQFLQMWNEGDEEAEENGSKEIIIQTSSSDKNLYSKSHEIMNNQEQLYVLGLVNVPSEELAKYEHIQKVSKLPENIKGYNSIELLNQFEEVIESSNMNNYKSPTRKEFHMSMKGVASKQSTGLIPTRPVSPLDVEAKISQSVIHKEVGCNFEIKPCSPKMLNVEVASPVQNMLAERSIEKITNPVMIKSPLINNMDDNIDCNIMKRPDHRLTVNENVRIPSCKMLNTQFSNNNSIDTMKSSYSLQDLESSSGLCLASLPRLDNDIELNFPEVNQQFINANKGESTVLTSTLRDLPTLDIIDQSDNQTKDEFDSISPSKQENDVIKSPYMVDTEKEFPKLSKYRKTKTTPEESKGNKNNISAVRTDSVIIKNPENIRNCEDNSNFSPYTLSNAVTDIQQVPINLTSQGNSFKYTESESFINNPQESAKDEEMSAEIAIDFSLNKNHILGSETKIESGIETPIEIDKSIPDTKTNINDPPRISVFDDANTNLLNDLKESRSDKDNECLPMQDTKIVNINEESDFNEILKHNELCTDECKPIHGTKTDKINEKADFKEIPKHDELYADEGEPMQVTITCKNDEELDFSEIRKHEELNTDECESMQVSKTGKISEKSDFNGISKHDELYADEGEPMQVAKTCKNDEGLNFNEIRKHEELYTDECEPMQITKTGKICEKLDFNGIPKRDELCTHEGEPGEVTKTGKINEELDHNELFSGECKLMQVTKAGNNKKKSEFNETDYNEIPKHDELYKYECEPMEVTKTDKNNEELDHHELYSGECKFMQFTKAGNNNKKSDLNEIDNKIPTHEELYTDECEPMEVTKTGKNYEELDHGELYSSKCKPMQLTKAGNNKEKSDCNEITKFEESYTDKCEHTMQVTKSGSNNEESEFNEAPKQNELYIDECESVQFTKTGKNNKQLNFSETPKHNEMYTDSVHELNVSYKCESIANTMERSSDVSNKSLSSSYTEKKSTEFLSNIINDGCLMEIDNHTEKTTDVLSEVTNCNLKDSLNSHSHNIQDFLENCNQQNITKEIVTNIPTTINEVDPNKDTFELKNNNTVNVTDITEGIKSQTSVCNDLLPYEEINDNDCNRSVCTPSSRVLDSETHPCSEDLILDNIKVEGVKTIHSLDEISDEDKLKHFDYNDCKSTQKMHIEESDKCLITRPCVLNEECEIIRLPKSWYGSKEMYSPWIQNLIMYTEGNIKYITQTNSEASSPDKSLVTQTATANEIENNVDCLFSSKGPLENVSCTSVEDEKMKEIERDQEVIVAYVSHKPISVDLCSHLVSDKPSEIEDSNKENEFGMEIDDYKGVTDNLDDPNEREVSYQTSGLEPDGNDSLTTNIEPFASSSKLYEEAERKEDLLPNFVTSTESVRNKKPDKNKDILITSDAFTATPKVNKTPDEIIKMDASIVSSNIYQELDVREDKLLNFDASTRSPIVHKDDELKVIHASTASSISHEESNIYADELINFDAITSSPIEHKKIDGNDDEVISFDASIASKNTHESPMENEDVVVNFDTITASPIETEVLDTNKDDLLITDTSIASPIVDNDSYENEDGLINFDSSIASPKVIEGINKNDEYFDTTSLVADDFSYNYNESEETDLSNHQSSVSESIQDQSEKSDDKNVSEYSCNKIQTNDVALKKCQPLKRSLSDSALNRYNKDERQKQENEENLQLIWPFKRRKVNNDENDILAQNLCNIINNRRNSISSFYNEDNVSFCILIDNSCIITEEENDDEEATNDQEKICYTELSEECIAEIQNSCRKNIETLTEVTSSPQQENACDYSNSFVLEEKSYEESWVDDIACVETVISDDIAEDVEISGPSSPKDNDESDNDESGVFCSSEHTDKVRFIYGDKMCSDDAQFVETLYNTPQMDVNKTLYSRETKVSEEYNEYYDNDSLEKMLSESNDHNFSPYVPKYIDTMFPTGVVNSIKTPENKENINDGTFPIFQAKGIALDKVVDINIDKIEHENMHLTTPFSKTQDDIVHSCESSVDNVFTFKQKDEGTVYTTSSSPEVSSTTSEEKNSGILLKITNYKGSITSQINDISTVNKRSSCKFTEDKEYLQSSSNYHTNRPLLTKAAQKYIPPLKESIRDLKVKLSLPQHSLMKLKQLKLSKDEPKVNKQNTNIPPTPKKPKPKFEDVLMSIDEIQIKMHKEKTKKSKISIPKVVIKKNLNGSHYASTSSKEDFNPDLTGRKWQPWVFIEKNQFIDKMAMKKKMKAIYSHRKRTYVLAEKFQKYKSVSSAKFVISPPISDNASSTGLKYTIRLKHTY